MRERGPARRQVPTGDLLRIQIFEGDPTAPVKTSQMKYLAAGPTVVEECADAGHGRAPQPSPFLHGADGGRAGVSGNYTGARRVFQALGLPQPRFQTFLGVHTVLETLLRVTWGPGPGTRSRPGPRRTRARSSRRAWTRTRPRPSSSASFGIHAAVCRWAARLGSPFPAVQGRRLAFGVSLVLAELEYVRAF